MEKQMQTAAGNHQPLVPVQHATFPFYLNTTSGSSGEMFAIALCEADREEHQRQCEQQWEAAQERVKQVEGDILFFIVVMVHVFKTGPVLFTKETSDHIYVSVPFHDNGPCPIGYVQTEMTCSLCEVMDHLKWSICITCQLKGSPVTRDTSRGITNWDHLLHSLTPNPDKELDGPEWCIPVTSMM